MTQTKRLQKNIGNAIIALSIFFLAWIYYPIFQLYLFPPTVSQTEIKDIGKEFKIVIEKIGVNTKIIENVDPFNKAEYNTALKEGVAHAKGTFLPGEKGTVFIFGHSSGTPWEITRNNTAFLRLGDLNNGDKILIFRNGKKITYTVFDKKTVWPNETKYLRETEKDQLILQTCTPIGTDFQRLLVFAKR